jgi:polyisoprenoid-binding protein YceI
VSLNVEFGGVQTDMYGRTVAGFEITGKIKRQEFGLQWNAVTEAGGVVVSDEVKLVANVEVVKA